jgi:serine/threonine protein kinase
MENREIRPGELIDGKYRIERALGSGGMGAVYLATHVGTERPVALKVIAAQFMMNEEFVARFQREAKAAGRLRHPNVVDVTDFGFALSGTGRIAYLVMEYLDGCSLDEVLAEESRLPLGWVVDILEQVCSAVEEAHQQGIIHRDLKPDNIWLEPNRRGGYTAKVLDFGLAKLSDNFVSLPPAEGQSAPGFHQSANISQPPQNSLPGITLQLNPTQPEPAQTAAEINDGATQVISGHHTVSAPTETEEAQTLLFPSEHTAQKVTTAEAATRELTRVGSVMGTPLYMSPEQCLSQPLDARSDIYSLAVIAYQMLAGVTPFSGDAYAVMRQHIEAEPLPLGQRRPGLPKKVALQIMKGLAKNPADRPASAASFASALRAYSQRPGNLLRQTITLLSEHNKVFIRLALIVFVPMMTLTLLQTTSEWLTFFRLIPDASGRIVAGVTGFFLGIINFVSATFHLAITARLVTQMLAAPLSRIHLRPAFTTLRQRFWPFLATNLRAWIHMGLGMICLFFPFLYFLYAYHLVAPVVMIEGLKGKEALKRSRKLVSRARRMVIFVLFLQTVLPMVTSSVMIYLARAVLRDLALDANQTGLYLARILPVINIPLHLLVVTISSILSSLLYLTTRQAGGETLRQTLGLFAEEELPTRQWQRRMRERLSANTPTRRQSESP